MPFSHSIVTYVHHTSSHPITQNHSRSPVIPPSRISSTTSPPSQQVSTSNQTSSSSCLTTPTLSAQSSRAAASESSTVSPPPNRPQSLPPSQVSQRSSSKVSCLAVQALSLHFQISFPNFTSSYINSTRMGTSKRPWSCRHCWAKVTLQLNKSVESVESRL